MSPNEPRVDTDEPQAPEDAVGDAQRRAIEAAERELAQMDPYEIIPEELVTDVMEDTPVPDAQYLESYVYDRMWYRRGVR